MAHAHTLNTRSSYVHRRSISHLYIAPRLQLCRVGIALITSLSIFVLVWSAGVVSTDINPYASNAMPSHPPRRSLQSKLDVAYPLWYGQVLRVIRKPLISLPLGWHGPPRGAGAETPALMLPPRAALLFLTPGPMPLSELWRQWFDDAAGLVPTSYLDHVYTTMPFVNARAAVERAQQHMITAMADSQATSLDRQMLFSIYMHTHPNYTMEQSNLFAPHVRGTMVELDQHMFDTPHPPCTTTRLLSISSSQIACIIP